VRPIFVVQVVLRSVDIEDGAETGSVGHFLSKRYVPLYVGYSDVTVVSIVDYLLAICRPSGCAVASASSSSASVTALR